MGNFFYETECEYYFDTLQNLVWLIHHGSVSDAKKEAKHLYTDLFPEEKDEHETFIR